MPYKLKPNQPDIEIVDGPFAKKTFRAGRIYTEIPPEEAIRFETIDLSTGSVQDSDEPEGGEE